MKNSIIYGLVIVMALSASCQQGGKTVKLESNIDSVSYAIGVLVGSNNLKQLEAAPGGETMNKEVMASAFRVSSVGEEAAMTEDQANELVRKFFEGAGVPKPGLCRLNKSMPWVLET